LVEIDKKRMILIIGLASASCGVAEAGNLGLVEGSLVTAIMTVIGIVLSLVRQPQPPPA